MPRPLPTLEEAALILRARRPKRALPVPPHAGRALGRMVKALDEKFGQGADGLKARWREIVGEALARRTEPVKLTKSGTAGQILELRVDGPAATLIQHQAQDILARVNLYLGEGAVARLRIVQGPLRPLAARAAVSRLPRRGRNTPLDAASEKALADSLDSAPDGRLKAALTRLGREVLRGEPR